MPKYTLEQYFQLHQNKAVDLSVRAGYSDKRWIFSIHPEGFENETWIFQVEGNRLTCINPLELQTDDEIVIMKICNFMDEMSKAIKEVHNNQLLSKVEELNLFLAEYKTWKEDQRERSEKPSGDSF